ncbi:MAG: sigma-70 family RNA polymerase sigma factor [Woeseiaceae bacterium]|nr:sigma-70 family RNA polymerase sigma factor [Woeseiaceae bacterium]
MPRRRHRRTGSPGLDPVPGAESDGAHRTRGNHNLGATTLVNETFLKLLSGGDLKPEDRQQFFALAATIMRQVIVDEVRYATAGKRQGQQVTFNDSRVHDDVQENAEFLLQVDELLAVLESEDERLVRVFECRYFAGLTTEESAEALGVSSRSVERIMVHSPFAYRGLDEGDKRVESAALPRTCIGQLEPAAPEYLAAGAGREPGLNIISRRSLMTVAGVDQPLFFQK